jgi:hypothetical protein
MLPQVRLAPWYQGQMGVWGSDVQRGLRWEPTGIVLFVDENHPGTHATGDGTNPEEPLNSIQTAINNLIAFATAQNCTLEGSVIVVASEATIAETVTIPATAPTHCTILGAGSSAHQPTWTAATAAGTALTVLQTGWTIEGFTFETGTAGTAILLNGTGSDGAYKTTIRNCRFDGLWGGLYGINFYGAPHRVRIENCEFLEYRRTDNTAYAIIVTDSSDSNPYECHIVGNTFWENENHVGSLGSVRAWNVSEFRGNVFHEGELIVATLMLDLRGGTRGNNIVTQNVFCGTYSQAGGYYANAGSPGNWVGNIAEDVASAQVADNGFTVAVPV